MSPRRAVSLVAGLGVLAVPLMVPSGAGVAATRPSAVVVRVPQAGAVVGQAVRAFVMSPKALRGERFQLLDASGAVVRSGVVGRSAGRWNASYGAVQPIDIGVVTTPGTYRVRVVGAVRATSLALPVAWPATVSTKLTRDGTAFLTVQRDGSDVVPGRLDRQPSHLLDRTATVYQPPTFIDPDDDELAAALQPVAGAPTRDVEGGWFDAGDYLKFTQTASYTLDATLMALRDSPSGGAALDAETAHGLQWLTKMWDPGRGVLYAQVGIGSGSDALDLYGDHDVWRLPEADDAADPAVGSRTYFVSHRPLFPANAAGQPISPNLAGRTAAAFALKAQLEATSHPTAARQDLQRAALLIADAKTSHVGPLVSAYPSAYYPESSWADDMELGTVEAARAARLLGDPRASAWLTMSEHWARAYLAGSGHDSLNLYDTSALAHADLAAELATTHRGAAVRSLVLADLKAELDGAVARADLDPFGSAAIVTDYDAVSHELGLVATAELYRRLTGSTAYDGFAAQQRAWVFGDNAWGTSFVIGEGTTYPLCPQHQVANLAGSLTGGHQVIIGAVVNGPNGADQFTDLGVPDGAAACPGDGIDRFKAFDTHQAKFLDNVAAWPSDEPADDFTATGILAYALGR
jgi:endoglucanase